MKYFACAAFVLLSSAVLTAQNSDPLIPAAKKGNAQIVSDSLKAGADVNARDEHGATALMWGSLRGYREVVAVLISSKADTSLQDDRGQTALHWAAMRGKTEIVKLLLEAGADRTKTDAAGKDAAAVALENGYYDLSVLLKKTPATASAPAAAKVPPKETVPPALIPAQEVKQTDLPKTEISGGALCSFYPAKTGESWLLSCVPTGVETVFYVLESSASGAVIQCESKKYGKRVDYYRQTMSWENDLLKVTTPGRSEILLKKPVAAGTKWFVERGGAVFTREIMQIDAGVSFAGKEYSCVVVRDIFPAAERPKRKGAGARKEVHYHCYAAGVGYIGTKTASFEKDGDVEHVPSFAEIPSWFLVRQRSAN